MKIAICDDSRECVDVLHRAVTAYYEKHGGAYTVDDFTSATELLRAEKPYDIVFLDVELGDGNGIEVAVKLQRQNKHTAIIIVTSHRGYLDDAMDIRAVRFIDKPVEPERVFSALDRAAAAVRDGYITVYTRDNRIVTLQHSEIVYAEARLRTSLLVTVGEVLIVREGIHQLQVWLSTDDFAVPHNSFVVNMNYIKVFRREEIVLATDGANYTVPVSGRRQAAFKKRYIRFIGEGLE